VIFGGWEARDEDDRPSKDGRLSGTRTTKNIDVLGW
jgi:hypothetical protein